MLGLKTLAIVAFVLACAMPTFADVCYNDCTYDCASVHPADYNSCLSDCQYECNYCIYTTCADADGDTFSYAYYNVIPWSCTCHYNLSIGATAGVIVVVLFILAASGGGYYWRRRRATVVYTTVPAPVYGTTY
eukprot:m.142566 g.142566  ORF g.142566 m.142566 type:complete len:133 (+) comp14061_c0_seq1:182-580(+)